MKNRGRKKSSADGGDRLDFGSRVPPARSRREAQRKAHVWSLPALRENWEGSVEIIE